MVFPCKGFRECGLPPSLQSRHPSIPSFFLPPLLRTPRAPSLLRSVPPPRGRHWPQQRRKCRRERNDPGPFVCLGRRAAARFRNSSPSTRGSRPWAGQTAPLAPDRWSAGTEGGDASGVSRTCDVLRVARIFGSLRLAWSRVKRRGSAALSFSAVQLLRQLPIERTQKQRTECSFAQVIAALVLDARRSNRRTNSMLLVCAKSLKARAGC